MSLFWKILIFFVLIKYGLLGYLFPAISQWAVNSQGELPIPAAAMSMYTILISVALGIYVISDSARVKDFMSPIHRFVAPKAGTHKIIQIIVLIAIPILIGLDYFQEKIPKKVSPTAIRIQHPTMPGKYEKLVNPFRTPTDEQIQTFIESYNEEADEYNESLEEEEDEDEDDDEGKTKVKRDKITDAAAGKIALLESWTQEGAALYAINCRPCHGMQADGVGPMAVGWRLQPANFRDPGTISTIVEPYAYWRVSKGGPGLPSASTPWDSAMPIWDLNLTEEERWKILLGEYFIAEVGPRQPEKEEH